MVEKQVLRDGLTILQYVPNSEDAAEFFARGILCYEMGDIPTAYQNLELVLKQARNKNNSDVLSRTAAFLGFLNLEEGKPQTARYRLARAHSASIAGLAGDKQLLKLFDESKGQKNMGIT